MVGAEEGHPTQKKCRSAAAATTEAAAVAEAAAAITATTNTGGDAAAVEEAVEAEEAAELALPLAVTATMDLAVVGQVVAGHPGARRKIFSTWPGT